jgi:hypothetical protein
MRWAIKSEIEALLDQKKVVFRELLNYYNTVCHIGEMDGRNKSWRRRKEGAKRSVR